MDLTRQGELVPLELRSRPILIVGCGTIGSWAAHTMLRMGFEKVLVCDFDKFESHNGPAQMLSVRAGGADKVEALESAQAALGLPAPVTGVGKWPPADGEEPKWARRRVAKEALRDPGLVVVAAADTVEGRRAIAEDARKRGVRRLIDFRMGPEGGAVLFVGERAMDWGDYMKSLEVEFVEEPTCGRRAMLTTGLALVGMGLGYWYARERTERTLVPRLRMDVGGGMMFAEA